MPTTIPFSFVPRFYQLPFLRAMDKGCKRALLIWNRRSGKDKTCFNFTIKKAFEKVGTYFYFLPTYKQAKKVIWDNIDNDGFRMLNHIPEELIKNTNATELKIELVNGSIIQLIGADEFKKSGVGTNPVGVVFSEYSLTDPEAWRYVSPILAANDGWAVFNFTPRGQNHAWQLLQQARDNDNWFTEILTINETNVLTPESLEEEKRMNPQDIIEQEYYCKFIEGAGSFFKRIEDNVWIAHSKEEEGHQYQIGVDWAKTQDYTVITPFDLTTFKALKQDRFNQIDYNLQKAKLETHYLRFFKPLINMDSTGVGEPIYDDLCQKGLRVFPYKFTEQSRRDLLVNLQLLLEQNKIKIPNDETLINELKSFRYTVNEKGRTRIEVPEGLHDDCVFSLALSVWQIPQNPKMIYSPLGHLLNKDITNDVKITSYE